MLSAVGIIVLWTWGLTPLWANIVGTVLLGIRFSFRLIKLMSEFLHYASEGTKSGEGYPVEKVGD